MRLIHKENKNPLLAYRVECENVFRVTRVTYRPTKIKYYFDVPDETEFKCIFHFNFIFFLLTLDYQCCMSLVSCHIITLCCSLISISIFIFSYICILTIEMMMMMIEEIEVKFRSKMEKFICDFLVSFNYVASLN